MLEALIDRMKVNDRRQYLLTGIIASTIVNMAGKQLEEGADPSSPQDFMPPEEKEEFDLRKLSPEEQAAHIMSSFSKKTYRHH
jgi:hypothetical protein